MGKNPRAGRTAVTQTREDPGTQPPAATGPRDPEEIQREIEETRRELGGTVEAFAQKTDVKAQAKRKVAETKASVAEKRQELLGKAKEASPDSAATAVAGASQKAGENPLPLAAAGAFAFGFLAGRFTKR